MSIELHSLDGTVSYNARFLVGGELAEKLEHGKIYTQAEMYELNLTFLKTTNKDDTKVKAWRCVKYT
jgi:hypothetical protein